eukprot:8203113-Pyramimonas_sp.AAC.1
MASGGDLLTEAGIVANPVQIGKALYAEGEMVRTIRLRFGVEAFDDVEAFSGTARRSNQRLLASE